MPVKIPTSADELKASLADATFTAEAFADPESAHEFILDYAEAVHAADPDLDAQIGEQVKANLEKIMADGGFVPGKGAPVQRGDGNPTVKGGDPTIHLRPSALAVHDRRVPTAKLNGVFNDFSEVVQAAWHRGPQLKNWADLQVKAAQVSDIRADYSGEIGSEGGFLIPEEFRAELLTTSLETGVVRPRARVLPMGQKTLTLPMVDETSHAGTLFGGVTTFWVSENETPATSEANFGTVKLEAKELIVRSDLPNTLAADAFATGPFFQMTAGPALAFEEDDAFLFGDGVTKPLGVMNSSAMVTVAAEGSQPAGSIVWENLLAMWTRQLPQSMATSVWVAHPSTIKELGTMALSVGTGGGPIWATDGTTGLPTMILGRPLVISEKMQPLGTAGDIALLDFSFYLIGDRQAMTLDSSADFRFPERKTVFLMTERVDGRPWLQSAITPKRGTDTLTPFVQIATRA